MRRFLEVVSRHGPAEGHRSVPACGLPRVTYSPGAWMTSRRRASSGGENYAATRILTEDRLSGWCRRLWGLMKSHDDGQPTASGASAGAAPEPPIVDWGALSWEEQQARLLGLRQTVTANHGRLPVVLVEAVWEVYNAILPPDVQRDLAHRLTETHLESFFAFVGLLTELDFDVEAVATASQALERDVQSYRALLAERAEAGPAGAPASLEREARLARVKRALVRRCFEVREAGSPLYHTWLRHSAARENGVRQLMDLRRVVHGMEVVCKTRLTAARPAGGAPASPEAAAALALWTGRRHTVQALDTALTLLFRDFFSREYLVMEELTWFSTPPSLLEQIMAAEHVHPMPGGLAEMRRRLQPTPHRHLFAFLHPAVVEEPLIAVQVALTRGIATSVDVLLGRPTPLAAVDNEGDTARRLRAAPPAGASEVDTAIFYSINSAQSALRGMDMGNLLIKRVVREVEGNINAARRARGEGTIDTFSTLSPLPGYVRWLAAEVAKLHAAAQPGARGTFDRPDLFGPGPAEAHEAHFYAPLREAVRRRGERLGQGGAPAAHDTTPHANAAALRRLLDWFQSPDEADPWWLDHALTSALERALLRSVAVYLCVEKRRLRILDPVGNFHVANGASIYQLNYLANTTAQGSRESACVMVNYLYTPRTISENVKNYEVHRHVPLGASVQSLLGDVTEGNTADRHSTPSSPSGPPHA